MTDSPLLALVHNASLLLALALVYDTLAERTARFARPGIREIFLGILVGILGMALMLTPWQLVPGIVFDTRSVLLGVAGLYFGLIPTAIAMAMTAALRLFQGGAAAWAGVGVIVASGCLGLAWRRWRRHGLEDISFAEVYALGIVIHVAMLALMLTLPWQTARSVLSAIALPVLLIYPVATALLGTLIANRLRRERLTARLTESEERLRFALAAANQGLYDVNLPTGEVTVNAEYGRLLGLDPATHRETVARWLERLHPDDREHAAAMYRDYVAGTVPEYRAEFRVRTADGGWRWILTAGRIVAHDPAGRALRMVGTHTDITMRRQIEERIRAAEAEAQRLLAESNQSRLALLSTVEDLNATRTKLSESESFYRGLFENMHEGFAYCRMIFEDRQPRDFVYLRVNAAFERMRAITGVENRRASEILPDFAHANPELREAYGRVASSGKPEVLEANIARLERWFLVSIFSPRQDHFVSAWIDITDRKRTEIENEKRLAELIRWHEVTLGRESRVIELKAEINELRRKLGEPARYGSATVEGGEPAR